MAHDESNDENIIIAIKVFIYYIYNSYLDN